MQSFETFENRAPITFQRHLFKALTFIAPVDPGLVWPSGWSQTFFFSFRRMLPVMFRGRGGSGGAQTLRSGTKKTHGTPEVLSPYENENIFFVQTYGRIPLF